MPGATTQTAAAILVEQRLEACTELLEFRGGQDVERGRRTFALRAASVGKLMLAAKRVSQPLLLPSDELVTKHCRLEPVGFELDARGRRPPRTLTAGPAFRLFDEPPLGECP